MKTGSVEINLLEQSTAVDAAARPRSISATSDRWNFHPQISPDGTRIAVSIDAGSGQHELWVSGDRDGTQARPLTTVGDLQVTGALVAGRPSPHVHDTRQRTERHLDPRRVDSGAARTVVSDTTSAVVPELVARRREAYFRVVAQR